MHKANGRKLAVFVAAVTIAGGAPSALAQTVIGTMPATTTATAPTAVAPTTSTAAGTAGNLTTAAAKKPPTSATPAMIAEAVQRSKARAAKALQGVPEQWGSEEPFTFNPAAQ